MLKIESVSWRKPFDHLTVMVKFTSPPTCERAVYRWSDADGWSVMRGSHCNKIEEADVPSPVLRAWEDRVFQSSRTRRGHEL